MPNYLKEFPSFKDEKLPPIPASWTDESWHNDACPCWKTPSGLYVWIDYELSSNREIETYTRFGVVRYSEEADTPNEDIASTDSWEEVLAALPEGDRA